jgi:hypothetical protein
MKGGVERITLGIKDIDLESWSFCEDVLDSVSILMTVARHEI